MPDEKTTNSRRRVLNRAPDRIELNALVHDSLVELPMQRERRERLLEGMCGIIRRMTRISASGILCLADHDERELAIALFAYLEGVQE